MVLAAPAAPASSVAHDVLAALRAATGPRHAFIDSQMPLAQAGAGLHAYRDHLVLLSRWLAPLQRGLAALPGAPADYAHGMQRRLALMHADLAATGDLPAADATGAAPAAPSDAFWWGVVYVIEGSQLGAGVLQRRLSATLAPFEPAYLGDAAHTSGNSWRRFVADLRDHVRGPRPLDDCCRGACWAFDRLIALLPEERAA